MDSFSDIALRIIAAFYAFVQFAGVRRLAMDRLLDNAIAAISGKKEQTAQTRAERLRWQMMLLLLVIGAPASMLTVAMIGVAIPLLIATNVLGLLNLAVILPKYVDPHDPPEDGARQKSWIATLAFLLFTLWTIHHWRTGGMTSVAETHPAALTLAGAFILLFAVHAVVTLRKAALGTGPTADSGGSGSSDEDFQALLRADMEAWRGAKFILRPVLGESVLVRADNGETVPYHLPIEELDDADREALRGWQTAFRKAIDPDDPRRATFASADARAAIIAEGERIFEGLRRKLGEDRIAFAPDPLAHQPVFHPGHVILRARVREWPLADADRPDDGIFPADLALSMRLEDDLLDWSGEYDEASLDAAQDADLSGPPDWTPERWADFDARGRALTQRLAAELAATGRAHVRTSYLEPEIGAAAPR